MTTSIIPNNPSDIDIENKSLVVQVTYEDINGERLGDRTLQWEIIPPATGTITAKFRSLTTVTSAKPENKGVATNILRPLESTTAGDVVTFKITDITDPANPVPVIDPVIYTYDDVELTPLSYQPSDEAFSSFADVAEVNEPNYVIKLSTKVMGTTGPKELASVFFNAPGATQFFREADPRTQIFDVGFGFEAPPTGRDGIATIYMGAVGAGIFNVTASYSNAQENASPRDQVAQTIFLDEEPGGDLPQISLLLDNDDNLDLDKWLGDFYPINIPSKVLTIYNLNPLTTSGAIVINNKIVKQASLQELVQGVNLAKGPLHTGEKNNFYYLLTTKDGSSYSGAIRKTKVIGSTPREPDDSLTRSLPAPQSVVSTVNSSTIIGDLRLDIPNYQGKTLEDKIKVTVYLNGYYDNTNRQHTDTIELPVVEVKPDNLTTSITVKVAQADLVGYSNNASDIAGTFQAVYDVTPLTGPATHSKILILNLSTYQI